MKETFRTLILMMAIVLPRMVGLKKLSEKIDIWAQNTKWLIS